jgi:hypothetical protein
MSTTSVWIFGFIGGILPFALRVAKSAQSDDLPDFLGHWWVYLATVVSGLIGGLVASLTNLDDASEVTGTSLKFAAVLVGYAAPSILANLGGIAGGIGGSGGGGGGGGGAPPATLTRLLRA